MKRLFISASLLFLIISAFAQPGQPIGGPATTPYARSVNSGATLPTTCGIGDLYYKTGATPGLYNCTAANTWAFSSATATKSAIGLGSVENTALSTWVGTTNITTLGTIGTGSWHGTTIDADHGGTGQTSFGTWTSQVYSAGEYTGNGAMTWTVDVGDVASNKYVILGKTMFWSLAIFDSSIGGTPNTTLSVVIPAGKTAVGQSAGACWQVNGGAYLGGAYSVMATSASIYRVDLSNWASSTNLTNVYCNMAFEIN